MAKYEIQGATLESIANAIREKTGSTEKIVPEAMASEIENIQGGAMILETESGDTATLVDSGEEVILDGTAADVMAGKTVVTEEGLVEGTFSIDSELNTQDNLIAQIEEELAGKVSGQDTSDATATAEDIAAGKTAYVDGVKLTGSLAKDKVAITPTIESTRLIYYYDGLNSLIGNDGTYMLVSIIEQSSGYFLYGMGLVVSGSNFTLKASKGFCINTVNTSCDLFSSGVTNNSLYLTGPNLAGATLVEAYAIKIW